jgi:hypothetical protein
MSLLQEAFSSELVVELSKTELEHENSSLKKQIKDLKEQLLNTQYTIRSLEWQRAVLKVKNNQLTTENATLKTCVESLKNKK